MDPYDNNGYNYICMYDYTRNWAWVVVYSIAAILCNYICNINYACS